MIYKNKLIISLIFFSLMSIGWGQYDNTPPEVTDLFINTLSVDVTELFQIHHTTTGE
tara:strand:- start:71 stop:241 length:171 start_codon:yes stop_codon:yes gene_type:complete